MEQHQVMKFTEMLKQMMRDILAKSNVTIHSLAQETACHADLADRAAHESDRNMMLILSQRDRVLLEEIRNALERVDLGEYGICFECGHDLGVARLAAQPPGSGFGPPVAAPRAQAATDRAVGTIQSRAAAGKIPNLTDRLGGLAARGARYLVTPQDDEESRRVASR